MDDYYEKIADYLDGEMSEEEKVRFIEALASDKELALAFKVYRTIEEEMPLLEKSKVQNEALKSTLQSLNKQYFELETPQPAKVIPLYAGKVFKILATIAASIALVLITYFGFFQPKNNIQVLANSYFKENLQHLNQTKSDPADTLQFGIAGKIKKRNTAQDSLQLGISAYNNQDYNKALKFFQKIYKNHPELSEAEKYSGFIFLATKEYDKALQAFENLANIKNTPNNPGLFLQALTYMQRNQVSDKQKAKQLLEQVVNNQAEGYKEAEQWLKKF
ncbi:zf-HC2 domain-containing protein [Adhaeribacter radiodurans]|uniref:Tetratricopeptide repeat protein n=1 Tax=Adhaeribacter radiodurans TaxID=2745197 RepID=A0A7L7LAS0_9BACT|nr:zf-HC2 domain-containing protein [Adhaeribacter radiodurans]QMU29932.1 tetratricopeptide repeat protein [Adhaeribacter radiodurans]